MNLRLISLFLLLSISACSQSPVYSNPTDAPKPTIKQVTQVQLLNLENHQIKFNAISTGCTQTNSFTIDSTISGNVCDITIYRTKPDLCRRAPQLINITLKWDQKANCKNLPVKLLNPQLTKPRNLF